MRGDLRLAFLVRALCVHRASQRCETGDERHRDSSVPYNNLQPSLPLPREQEKRSKPKPKGTL